MTSQFAPTDFPKQEYPTPEELWDRLSRYEAALRKIAFVNKSEIAGHSWQRKIAMDALGFREKGEAE